MDKSNKSNRLYEDIDLANYSVIAKKTEFWAWNQVNIIGRNDDYANRTMRANTTNSKKMIIWVTTLGRSKL